MCPVCRTISTRLKYGLLPSHQSTKSSSFAASGIGKGRPAIYECLECGHVFQDTHSWPQNLLDLYGQVEDDDYEEIERAKRLTFRRAAQRVGAVSSSATKVLEVGAYTGLFGDELKQFPGNYEGTELSKWALECAVRRGLSVRAVAIENLSRAYEPESFDITVAWDVLEHVRDPHQALQSLARVTRHGGFVFLSTLDVGNWFPSFLGPLWPWFIPMHLHYFDKRGLERLAQRVGLRVLESWPHVHFTTLRYVWSRFSTARTASFLERRGLARMANKPFPVGFGDVRAFKMIKDDDVLARE